MRTEKVRVRFAPSPTGPLHMGGVRTALFNYLFAKQHGGDFILRIEDTDSQRFVPGAEAYIIEALNWCGIVPDEGVLPNGTVAVEPAQRHPHAPYRQSLRKHLYRQYAEQLIEQRNAYYAFDSAESLELLRKEYEEKGETFTYNYKVRNSLDNSLHMSKEETERRLNENDHWVIRFNIPENETVHMQDMIRGEMKVHTSTLDDKVLWKAQDGLPTYHLANIVDDRLMEISHVIRGEEWLPSLPLHYLLYQAFGWQEEQPEFAHLSLLLKPDGKGKLSKRDGDRLGFPVFPLEWTGPAGEKSRGYREEGYFPEAFVNLIALLGWNPGTEQELFSMQELIEAFSIERVVKSGARFNPEKAKWFNQQYLRMHSNESLAVHYLSDLKNRGIDATPEKAAQVVSLIRERACFVHEFWDLSFFFFQAPRLFDQAQQAKHWKAETPALMQKAYDVLSGCEPFGIHEIEEALHTWIAAEELKTGAVMNALRLCIVGAPKGPGMADIMAVLGKKETLERLHYAIKHL